LPKGFSREFGAVMRQRKGGWLLRNPQGACGSAVEPRLRARGPARRGAITFGEFSPPQCSSLTESRIFLSVCGAAVSTLLHLVLLTSAIWSNSGERVHAHQLEGIIASRGLATDDIALQWVTVDEQVAADASRAAPPIVPLPRMIAIAVTAPVPELAANFPDAVPDEANRGVAGNSDASARIYGQYLGQINARIDRAWVRPRTPIGAMRFLCQARIEQDNLGNVRGVALDHCNGTPVWQRSLVDAIKSASPLPAPADPAVFSPKIQMAFHEEATGGEVTTDPLRSAAALKPSFESASVATSLAALRQMDAGEKSLQQQ
jgi:hypothetical protein